MTILQWRTSSKWTNPRREREKNEPLLTITLVLYALFIFIFPSTNKWQKFQTNPKLYRNCTCSHSHILLFCAGVWAKIKSFPLDCMFAFESGMNTVMRLGLLFFSLVGRIHCFCSSIKSVLKRTTRSITTDTHIPFFPDSLSFECKNGSIKNIN